MSNRFERINSPTPDRNGLMFPLSRGFWRCTECGAMVDAEGKSIHGGWHDAHGAS